MDREKVAKGVKCCSRPNNTNLCGECPYNKSETRFGCMHRLITDVFAMLKEQEAVEPEVEVLNEIDRLYRCPKCHKCFFYEKQKYCDQCGQKVKWA